MKNDKILNTALLSLFINFLYCLYNGFIGFASRSWWFITVCAYYIVLSIMRSAVLLTERKENKNLSDKRFVAHFTGIMFILLSLILLGTAYITISSDIGTKHHKIVMITIALYSFTKVSLGVINLVKAIKNDSQTVRVLRNISFADAFVSIYSLQRSMLVSFEGMEVSNIRLLNSLTGAAVCLLVLILGINLIGGKEVTMAKSKLIKANEKLAQAVVGGYKKIEKGVVLGYKKIEEGVVDSYTKIEDKFVEQYLTHDGETVEEAKVRIKKNNKNIGGKLQ